PSKWVSHKACNFSDKNGVFSIINNAIFELSIHDWILATGVNAKINKIINNIKYTSKKPNNAPSVLFIAFKIGKAATKSNIEAIICNAIFTAKNITAKEMAL